MKLTKRKDQKILPAHVRTIPESRRIVTDPGPCPTAYTAFGLTARGCNYGYCLSDNFLP